MRQLTDLVGRVDALMSTSSDSDGDSEGDVAGGSDFFEGAEKLFEITFNDATTRPGSHVTGKDTNGNVQYGTGHGGLRTVSRSVWEDMLTLVNCNIVSHISSTAQDAYLLRSEHLPSCHFHHVTFIIPPHTNRPCATCKIPFLQEICHEHMVCQTRGLIPLFFCSFVLYLQ